MILDKQISKAYLLKQLDKTIEAYILYYGEESVHNDDYETLTQLEIKINEEV